MVKLFPIIFIVLWSSAFVTTKPIVNNSDPFSALAFRFLFVAIGFFLFSLYEKKKILIKKNFLLNSLGTGVLFHGFYLGGVFYSVFVGLPVNVAALTDEILKRITRKTEIDLINFFIISPLSLIIRNKLTRFVV